MSRNDKIIDEDYLNFIRSRCCLACRRAGGVDADHLKAQGWRQAKRNDYTAIPLCRACHSERHTTGTAAFEDKYQMNIWEEALFLLAEYTSGRIRGR